VRTIIDQKRGNDRTSKKHRARIDASDYTFRWKRQKKTGAGLPQQAQRVVDAAAALIKEAKGQGRVRAGS
jgi:hypothetical protein